MRSRVLWLLPIVVAALLVLAAYIVGGRPQPVYQSAGRIVALQADDEGLAWLETEGDDPAPQGRVFTLDRRSPSARCLYPEQKASSFALAGDLVLVVAREGDDGTLLSVPRSGGQPTTLAEGLSRPGGLVAQAGSAYWTETKASAAPHVWHIPTLRSQTVVRGQAFEAPGGRRAIAALESATEDFRGSLLGVHEQRLYWLDVAGATSQGSWSAIQRAPSAGGLAETVAREKGARTALLNGSTLYWTAPSQDSGDPMHYCSVRRAELAKVSPVTLTDWLTPGGCFYTLDGRLHYAAMDGLWAVPESLDGARRLRRGWTGRGMAAGWRGAVYEVTLSEGGGDALLRRPFTLGARLRAAAGRS